MSTGTVVVVHENKQIPDKFLDILLDKHKTSVGYAVKNSYGVVEMENLSEFDLKTPVREIERTYNGNTICFHFSNEQEPSEDDTQPFPIIIEGEDVKLCVLLEGEFPGYTEVVEKPKEEEKPIIKTGGLRDKLKLKQQETPFTDKPSETKTSVPPVA